MRDIPFQERTHTSLAWKDTHSFCCMMHHRAEVVGLEQDDMVTTRSMTVTKNRTVGISTTTPKQRKPMLERATTSKLLNTRQWGFVVFKSWRRCRTDALFSCIPFITHTQSPAVHGSPSTWSPEIDISKSRDAHCGQRLTVKQCNSQQMNSDCTLWSMCRWQ